MKISAPNFEIAKGIVETYAEDGVRGKVGYDPDTIQWCADLNDEDYGRYTVNLAKRKSEMHDLAMAISEKSVDATNVQAGSLTPPEENQTRLSLYLIDLGCNAIRGFKITNGLKELIERKMSYHVIGSTCELCGKKMMVVITWEDIKS